MAAHEHIRMLPKEVPEKDLCHSHQELKVVQAKDLCRNHQVLMADPVKGLYGILQVLRVDQETAVDHIRQVLKVAPAMDDDHNPVLKDSCHSLLVLDHRIDLDDLAEGIRYRSRTLEVVDLCPSTRHPSSLGLQLPPLAPAVCPLFRSRPFLLCQDLGHKVPL